MSAHRPCSDIGCYPWVGPALRFARQPACASDKVETVRDAPRSNYSTGDTEAGKDPLPLRLANYSDAVSCSGKDAKRFRPPCPYSKYFADPTLLAFGTNPRDLPPERIGRTFVGFDDGFQTLDEFGRSAFVGLAGRSLGSRGQGLEFARSK